MNNLIEKAIQAINDNKQEYAIGLLEGVLEMSGTNSIPAKVTVKLPPAMINTQNITKSPDNTTVDPADVLNATAATSLATIKALSDASKDE